MQKWFQSEVVTWPAAAKSAATEASAMSTCDVTVESSDLRRKVQQQQQKLERQRQALQNAYKRTRNINKKYMRKSTVQQAPQSANVLQALTSKLSSITIQLSAANNAVSAQTRLKVAYKAKYTAASRQAIALRSRLAKLQAKLTTMEQEFKKAEEKKQQQVKSIRTMTGRPPRFTDAVRQCSIELLGHNVGTNHVAAVIRSVIQTLTDCTIERLPSPAKMCAFLGEAKQLVLTQIGEKLVAEANLTLHRDGTTKEGTKYYGAQVVSESGVINIGLSAVMSGSAQHSFDAVLDMLKDVEVACHNAGSTQPILQKAIVNIKNTMTDRCIVEKNVNNLLQVGVMLYPPWID